MRMRLSSFYHNYFCLIEIFIFIKFHSPCLHYLFLSVSLSLSLCIPLSRSVSFSHIRGILQTGLYTMNLWKGPVSNSKIESVDSSCYDLNPCAPCNNNPDSHAVKVTIQFPRYTYPVFFPSSDPETCSFLLRYYSIL